MSPNLPNLGTLPIELLLPLSFYVVAVIYLIFTAVFYYHWNNYSINKKVTTVTYIIYAVITVPLLLISGGLAL